jgi:very-short-patch-repair endonuclease
VNVVKMPLPQPEILLGFARDMRAASTPAEARIWRALRAKRLGPYKWKRQQPFGAFIADFVCFDARLIVEIDGGQHGTSETDRARDAWFEKNGYRVLRFWNNEVSENMDAVLEKILETLENGKTREDSR